MDAKEWLLHLNGMAAYLPYDRAWRDGIHTGAQKKSRAMFPSRATCNTRNFDQPPVEDLAGWAAVEAAGGAIAVEAGGGVIAVEAGGGVIAGAVDAVAGAAAVADAAAPPSF